ncbi:uncharacterized protein KQ657_000495 [Scheffersomyces spartinae]|uniref:Uncharacterized protein n=1 Tax=Scheffersomyces spartinae TaxID=45513 RepID=A0A9P7V9P7_9ASCO|nr:uncharacterized protein KQ657_000495 [Scheffersomyces spartinae]KAG7193802.1 hypothetical protein KQ657_000495 [Scheffersomyces spartinae]
MSGLLFLTINTQYKYEKPRRNSITSKESRKSLKNHHHHRKHSHNNSESKHFNTRTPSTTASSIFVPPKEPHTPHIPSSWETLINNFQYKQTKFFTLKNLNILRYTYYVELIDDFEKIHDFYSPKQIGFASFQLNSTISNHQLKVMDDFLDPCTPSPSKPGNPFQEGPQSIRTLLSSSNIQFWNALYQELKMDTSVFSSIPSIESLLGFLIDLIDTFLDSLIKAKQYDDDDSLVRTAPSTSKEFNRLYGDMNSLLPINNSKLLSKVIEELVENIRIYQLRTKAEYYDILGEFLRFLLLHLLSSKQFRLSQNSLASTATTTGASIFLPSLNGSTTSSINSTMIPTQSKTEEDLETLAKLKHSYHHSPDTPDVKLETRNEIGNTAFSLEPAKKESNYFLRPPSEKRKRFLDRFKKIQDSEK